jgi:hypothetical protein
LVLIALLHLALVTSAPASATPPSALQTSILALDSARRTAQQELETTAFNAAEASDYRDFIVYLNTQIVNYCLQFASQAPPEALAELPCPVFVGSSATADLAESEAPREALTGPPPAEAQARSEQTAAVEAQLFASLAEFDDMLLKEEAHIAAHIPSQRESGAPGRGETAASSALANGGEPSASSGAESAVDSQTESAAEDSTQQKQGPPEGANTEHRQSSAGAGQGAGDSRSRQATFGAPGGQLPPPEDDDIVARQLREAAEKEPDPELKQKLWEEYWKYKGVKKGG